MYSPAVLVIDDHPGVLQHRKQSLEGCGYSVTTADSVLSALKLLERAPFVAVLVEYRFEGIDSEAVAYHIKTRFPNQPIILLSAYADIPERVLWLVDEYVMRSDPVDTLVTKIQQLACISNIHQQQITRTNLTSRRCAA